MSAALGCGLSSGFGKVTSATSTVVAVQGMSGSVLVAASAQTPTGGRRWLVRRCSTPARRMQLARRSGRGCQRGWGGRWHGHEAWHLGRPVCLVALSQSAEWERERIGTWLGTWKRKKGP
jgi:hypothetical protein